MSGTVDNTPGSAGTVFVWTAGVISQELMQGSSDYRRKGI